jgi:hypothetical protein
MGRRTILVAAISVAIVLAGGGVGYVVTRESPERAWDQIRAAACDGDLDQFYSRVDWSSIAGLTVKRVARDNAIAALVGDNAMEKVRREWDDDIRLGKAGSWCQATRTDSDRETRVVHWTTPSGKSKSGRFDRSGGKYILIDVQND